jgi:hypothetical protein
MRAQKMTVNVSITGINKVASINQRVNRSSGRPIRYIGIGNMSRVLIGLLFTAAKHKDPEPDNKSLPCRIRWTESNHNCKIPALPWIVVCASADVAPNFIDATNILIATIVTPNLKLFCK